ADTYPSRFVPRIPMEAKPELAELYRRAVADPHSISRAERNAIWGHPPPEEENRLCVAKTGLTRAGLVAKAAAPPDELTLCEAKIICHHRGVNFDDKAEEAAPITGIVDRLDRLEVALLEYIRVCKKKPTPLEKLYNEALARLCAWREHEKARIVKVGTPWIRKMLEAGLLEEGAEYWGFVVFRTGCYHGEENEALWQRFRDHLLKVAETSVLHWYSGPELWPSLRIVFVEDKELKGASNEQLRIWFRKMRDRAGGEQHLPKGIRTKCFLVADEAVIRSEAAQTPYTPRCKYMDVPEFGVEIPRRGSSGIYPRRRPGLRNQRGHSGQGPWNPDQQQQFVGCSGIHDCDGKAGGRGDGRFQRRGDGRASTPRHQVYPKGWSRRVAHNPCANQETGSMAFPHSPLRSSVPLGRTSAPV
ncbi:hypothetical protein N657DRAFT_650082, partial [Parathielavia appendiculata]